MEKKKAVVLLSGGLDSATVLAMAHDQGFDCYALSLDYGQRSATELAAAKRVVESVALPFIKYFPLPSMLLVDQRLLMRISKC